MRTNSCHPPYIYIYIYIYSKRKTLSDRENERLKPARAKQKNNISLVIQIMGVHYTLTPVRVCSPAFCFIQGGESGPLDLVQGLRWAGAEN